MNETPITVVGRLTADPVLRATTSGTAMATFRLATNVRKKDPASGEYVDGQTSYYNVRAYRSLGANLAACLALGERLRALEALRDDPRSATRTLDWQAEVLAQGELLSSTLGVAYLRAQGLDFGWVDARHWLQANFLPNQSPWAQRLSVSCNTAPDQDWRRAFAGHRRSTAADDQPA